jgi:AraC-like DNA-binding protein
MAEVDDWVLPGAEHQAQRACDWFTAPVPVRTERQNWVMPMLERVGGEHVIVGSYFHDLDEPTAVTEWWPELSIVFTSHGAWEVRARRGRGDVMPDTVLVNEPAAEHDCLHPHGLDDRMLCVMFREDADPGPALLVPHVPALYSLRRSLIAELRSTVPDAAEVDALGLAMLQTVREASVAPSATSRPGARSRVLVQRLRAIADAQYRDPDLDLVVEARALGLSRTRFVHVFRDVVGVTPHRYVLELRAGHAARLLRGTREPVTGVCFASGFGSVPSFHSAFRSAYGMTPSAYRAEPFEFRYPLPSDGGGCGALDG